MKKMTITGIIMFCVSSSAMAYGYTYDQVDAAANLEQAIISQQEQAQVMHELREGDFREAQMVIQRDEAIKNQIRQNEAAYDNYRDMNRYNSYGNNFGYIGW